MLSFSKVLFCITVSAISYYLSLHFDHLFFLIFIFLLPLNYLVLKNIKLTFFMGFIWGLIFYSLHFFSIFKIFAKVSHNFWYLPPIILIFYFSFWSGVWFFFCRNSALFYVSTLLYFVFVNYFILSFIEPGCGYAIINPLNTFHKSNKKLEIKNSISISINKKSNGPIERALDIKEAIESSLKKDPNIKNIFFTESTFPYPLNKFLYILNWWPQGIHIFFCGHWKVGKKLANRAFHIFNGEIIEFYDKRRLIPVFEYVPCFLKFIPELKKQFIGTKEFIYSKKSGFFTINGKKYNILICSDLFFKSIFCPNGPTVLFINNSKFDDNFQSLLFRCIDKDIFMVSY